MAIKRVIVNNYKQFQNLDITVNEDLTVLIGNNGVGKSTILELIHLALTGTIRNKPIYYELNPYLFNINTTNQFINNVVRYRQGELEAVIPPQITIEIFFSDTDDEHMNELTGAESSISGENCGLTFRIMFSSKYEDEYKEYIQQENVSFIPTEYYEVEWFTFAGKNITPRSIPVKSLLIDSSESAINAVPKKYFLGLVNDTLDDKQKANLSVLYRSYKEQFAHNPDIVNLNFGINEKKKAFLDDEREVSLSLDISNKTNWETAINAYVEGIPFENIGRGDQNILKTIFAVQSRKARQTILLIEEPENHLSFSNMRMLLVKLNEIADNQQIFVSTHDSYILNKLKLDNLLLISESNIIKMTDLPDDTVKYFQKIPSYNTLRFILSKKVILVEGPADELIVSKSFSDNNEGKLPLDCGVDIISVNGLSFKRFLDISKLLEIETFVVTDNDGDYEKNITRKYEEYQEEYIHICASENNHLKTLEPQFLHVSSNYEKLKRVLEKDDLSSEVLNKYMTNNKADWALKVYLDDSEEFDYPEYILNAVR
ncbi:ATP-dependent endonuclease [Bacillus canaveralius]|uniref:ATP-dependent endonuclease n=1 Tax=Bacillus canaveralius TaxID=1403243 RepID=A0A2N5GNC5_9BACI|nr:AAA family ATPase [Bacillus canaveralius]PLR83893.1 ATP-dependent endonuclease [Bacillus canaveralius]PLR88425.1 ATP-dependent endonuclease [Bacillus canaveralius]